MLQVFRSLPVVRETHRADALPASAIAYRRDTITLGWEERLRTRARRRSDSGLEFGTALPRGMILKGGDCFVLEDPEVVVVVAERAEPVFVITPQSAREWGLFAYFIGNSHQPMAIDGDEIICPDVAGVEQVLTYHEIGYVRALRPFSPVSLMGDSIGPGHEHRPSDRSRGPSAP